MTKYIAFVLLLCAVPAKASDVVLVQSAPRVVAVRSAVVVQRNVVLAAPVVVRQRAVQPTVVIRSGILGRRVIVR